MQYRDKLASSPQRQKTARDLVVLARSLGSHAHLIVNDDPVLARACDADGVHLGPKDPPISRSRDVIGAGKILGSSAGTVDEAGHADLWGADYVGVGDIFGTQSKSDAGKPIGISGLEEIARSTRTPVIAIGGITKDNLREAIAAGAHGVAVLSPVCLADDPQAATLEIAQALRAALAAEGIVWIPFKR